MRVYRDKILDSHQDAGNHFDSNQENSQRHNVVQSYGHRHSYSNNQENSQRHNVVMESYGEGGSSGKKSLKRNVTITYSN